KRGKDFGRGKPYDKRGKKPDESGSSGGKVGGDRNCFKCECRATVSLSA
ncbi:hypothetical protein A2U01_0101661, partial [Trifolium medium]|nr:hypothetical protein [Trifolium medium]